MTISLICNIVAFVCACVLFYNFRKAMRLYRRRCDMYDGLYKEYTELEEKYIKLFWKKEELCSKVADLEEKNESLRKDVDVLFEDCAGINDFKRKIRVATECFEKANKCTVKSVYLHLVGHNDDIKKIDVEL